MQTGMYMVCIFDTSNSRRGSELREIFLRSYIPCAVKEYAKISDSLVNIFFSDTAWLFEYKLKKLDPESVLILDTRLKVYEFEKSRVVNSVIDILNVKYGINPNAYRYKRFSQIGRDTLYCGRYLLLTESENMILRYISVCEGRWCTAEEIIAYCLDEDIDKHTVAVHVSNIVEKSLKRTLVPIIATKRNCGYKIYDSVIRHTEE